jgi:hypothetical protein
MAQDMRQIEGQLSIAQSDEAQVVQGNHNK